MRILRFLGVALACAALLWLALRVATDPASTVPTDPSPGEVLLPPPSVAPPAGSANEEATPARVPVADEEAGRGWDAPALTLHVTRSDTAEPVPHLPLRLMRADGHAPAYLRVLTDETGIATVAHLAPGEIHVQPGSGPLIVDARPTHRDIVLDPHYRVRGIVVDPTGAPLANATLWATDTTLSERGAGAVAVTGADGRFGWTSWDVYEHVYATARGYSPSPVFDVFGTPDDPPAELRIALRPARGSLAGIVVDARERAVAHAEVALRANAAAPVDAEAEKRFFHTQPRRVPQRLAVTGADGRFGFGDLAGGPASLAVRAPGLGQSRLAVEVEDGGETAVRVRLSAPSVVLGRVRDDRGKPVPGATVAVGHCQDFGYVASRSGPGGDYVLEGVPGGSLRVTASKEGHDTASEQVSVEREPTRVDFVLPHRRVVRGRLLDEDGAPLRGWLVSDVDGRRGGQVTDERGEFELRQDGENPPGLMGSQPMDVTPRRFHPPRPLQREAAHAGDIAIYRPRPGSELTAWIRGRMLLPEESADTMRVGLQSRSPSWSRSVRIDASGTFELGPLPPGTFELEFSGGTMPRQDLGSYALAAGQRLDLGAIEARARVPLHLDVVRDDGRRLESLEATVRGADGSAWRAGLSSPGVVEVEPLPAGQYELTLHGTDLQWQRVSFELRAGQPETLRIMLSAGHPVRFRALLPVGAEPPRTVHLVIETIDGQRVAELDAPWHRLRRGATACGLATGSYRCRATAAQGLAGAAGFAAGDGSPAADVVLELR